MITMIAWVITVAIWLTTCLCWRDDAKAYKINAVKYGAAEWRVSPEGDTTFHWIEK